MKNRELFDNFFLCSEPFLPRGSMGKFEWESADETFEWFKTQAVLTGKRFLTAVQEQRGRVAERYSVSDRVRG